MEPREPPGLSPDADVISLLAFWAAAGVDTVFEDAPINRFAPPSPPDAPPRAAPTPLAPDLPVSRPPSAPRTARADGVADQVERARAAAQSAGDWPALQAVITAFETTLRPRGAPTVLARGSVQPRLLVIGEGPSAEDEAAGAPFSGRVGALLDRMLAASGVTEHSLILPTAFWRGRDRSAAAALEAVSAPFLTRAVELLAPRAILLAGEAAARSVLGRSEPILQLRGRWADWAGSDVGGPVIPALPIFHPAFLLQHPGAKKRTWSDLLTLAERFAQP